jgi:sugar/nucleoside kinase (ribokinase family)
MSNARFLVAGHGCVDLTPEITASNIFTLVRPGTLVPTGPAKFSIGGAVPNTGAALSRLGNRNVFLRCPSANDAFGDVLRKLLLGLGFSETSMDLSFCAAEDDAGTSDGGHPPSSDTLCVGNAAAFAANDACTSFSIIISPKGQDRFILHCPGVNPKLQAAVILAVPMAQHDWLHVGYPPLLHRLIASDGLELSEVFAAGRRAGVTTSLDMCTPDTSVVTPWRAIFQRVLPFVDCFTPSYEEIAMCLGTEGPPTVSNLRLIADELLGFGARIVLIKMSSTGLYLKTLPAVNALGLGRGAELGLDAAAASASYARQAFLAAWSGVELLSPSFKVDCVGTLGAGDCTVAAFLTCLSLRSTAAVAAGQTRERSWLSPSEVLQIANAGGACNVEAEDALTGLRSIDATRQRIAAGWDRNELPLAELGLACPELDAWGNVRLS